MDLLNIVRMMMSKIMMFIITNDAAHQATANNYHADMLEALAGAMLIGEGNISAAADISHLHGEGYNAVISTAFVMGMIAVSQPDLMAEFEENWVEFRAQAEQLRNGNLPANLNLSLN